MPKEEAIKFAVLHLNSIAHEWWHHSMATTRHDQINSYVKFTESLINCFGKKDLELHFKELVQVAQWASVDNSILEL